MVLKKGNANFPVYTWNYMVKVSPPSTVSVEPEI